MRSSDLRILDNLKDVNDIILSHIKQAAARDSRLKILEAGCGRRWPFEMTGVSVEITGVDVDKDALEARRNIQKDLDKTIEGDLRTVDLAANSYDIIYSSYVLEHVEGAETVLENFLKWVKPGGLIIVTFPDRQSVYGFCTRVSPFWVHVLYKRYLLGMPNAGKPGFGPYPTVHDRIIARKLFREFVANKNLTIKAEYGFGKLPGWLNLFNKFIGAVSLGKLDSDHNDLLYILETPPLRAMENETRTA